MGGGWGGELLSIQRTALKSTRRQESLLQLDSGKWFQAKRGEMEKAFLQEGCRRGGEALDRLPRDLLSVLSLKAFKVRLGWTLSTLI